MRKPKSIIINRVGTNDLILKTILLMKNFVTIFVLALCLFVTNSSSAALETRTSTVTEKASVSSPAKVEITMADIRTLSIKEIEAKAGHKLTWREKIGLKLAKNKLKRERGDGDGSIGLGFVLGFLLGLIGVLIAYLAFKGESKTIKGAWYGVLTIVLLTLVLVLAAGA